MLLGLQKEINIISKTIALAAKKNPAQTIMLQNASNIAVGELNNEIGNIIQFNSENNGSGNPVNVLTPSFISEQYEAIRDKDIQRAYELVGKSQTSASGRKEVGIESGVAIATLADLQSERFQVLLGSFIDLFTQEAKLVAEIGMKNATIITPSRYELKLTWDEVREDYSKMRIEFSSADALSKDPSEKLKQLQSLAQAVLFLLLKFHHYLKYQILTEVSVQLITVIIVQCLLLTLVFMMINTIYHSMFRSSCLKR